jgi:transcriptional regulator with PAS, ATPase and Fis domain
MRPDLDAGAALDLRAEVRRFERVLIDKAIRIHGSKRKAAKALGVDIGTIVRKTVETADDGADTRKIQQGD